MSEFKTVKVVREDGSSSKLYVRAAEGFSFYDTEIVEDGAKCVKYFCRPLGTEFKNKLGAKTLSETNLSHSSALACDFGNKEHKFEWSSTIIPAATPVCPEKSFDHFILNKISFDVVADSECDAQAIKYGVFTFVKSDKAWLRLPIDVLLGSPPPGFNSIKFCEPFHCTLDWPTGLKLSTPVTVRVQLIGTLWSTL